MGTAILDKIFIIDSLKKRDNKPLDIYSFHFRLRQVFLVLKVFHAKKNVSFLFKMTIFSVKTKMQQEIY